jgi:thioredoxin-dependent peroxiredoxin
MATLAIGKKMPVFEAEATGGKKVSSKELIGRPCVLYFYPRDNTPGCTIEGNDFRDQYARFKRRKVAVYGISRDSLKSHEKFKEKCEYPFDLITDPDEELCKAFDVIRDKNMYGKKVRGIERSTFLFDADGVLRNEWRKVKIDGHVDEVLEAVKAL